MTDNCLQTIFEMHLLTLNIHISQNYPTVNSLKNLLGICFTATHMVSGIFRKVAQISTTN